MLSEDKPQSPGTSATVLIVDDNKEVVDILSRLLSRHNLTPVGAYSGPECLDIVRSRPIIDVVILDVMMPGMDGLEVCEELKRLSPSLPVILLTAKDDMATRAAGMALGVSEFVVKPINNRDLLARVQTQLNTRQWEREIDRASATIDPLQPPASKK